MTKPTPTTEQVRTDYATWPTTSFTVEVKPAYLEEFDRWLAAHDAEVLRASSATPTAQPTEDQLAQIIEDYMKRATIPAGNLFAEPVGVTPLQLAHKCGGDWWRIIRRAGAGDVISGGVLLAATEHGDRIVGHSGYFECLDCGATR